MFDMKNGNAMFEEDKKMEKENVAGENSFLIEERVEEEKEGEIIETEYPYRPEDIRIEQKMLSLFQVNRWISQEILIIHPEFQRNIVWDIKRKSLLIESLMLKIPIPAFYLDEDENGMKTVIDGMQRLSTIHDFLQDKFKLRGLQYLTQCEKKTFSQLDPKYRYRIEDTQLAVNILDAKCPKMVKFDVFRRINTGGMALNAQEVRNIMATQKTRKLLLSMAHNEMFHIATKSRMSDKRMGVQELCLRYITYLKSYNYEKKEFEMFDNMTHMLDEMIVQLNDASNAKLEKIYDQFEESMMKCYALFGENVFCKPGVGLLNRALFISFSIIMSYETKTEEQLKNYTYSANEYLKKLLDENKDYYDAITSSTSSRKNMEIQFEYARKLMEDICV